MLGAVPEHARRVRPHFRQRRDAPAGATLGDFLRALAEVEQDRDRGRLTEFAEAERDDDCNRHEHILGKVQPDQVLQAVQEHAVARKDRRKAVRNGDRPDRQVQHVLENEAEREQDDRRGEHPLRRFRPMAVVVAAGTAVRMVVPAAAAVRMVMRVAVVMAAAVFSLVSVAMLVVVAAAARVIVLRMAVPAMRRPVSGMCMAVVAVHFTAAAAGMCFPFSTAAFPLCLFHISQPFQIIYAHLFICFAKNRPEGLF